MPGSEIDLAAIEARCRAATPGPWDWYDPQTLRQRMPYGWEARWTSADAILSATESSGAELIAAENRDFIAHARTDLPALVARVRELESTVAALRETQAERSAEVGAACAALVEAFVPADARDELRCAGLARLVEVAVDHHSKHHDADGSARLALRNVLALSARIAKTDPTNADHLRRFCAAAGVVPEITR